MNIYTPFNKEEDNPITKLTYYKPIVIILTANKEIQGAADGIRESNSGYYGS